MRDGRDGIDASVEGGALARGGTASSLGFLVEGVALELLLRQGGRPAMLDDHG